MMTNIEHFIVAFVIFVSFVAATVGTFQRSALAADGRYNRSL